MKLQEGFAIAAAADIFGVPWPQLQLEHVQAFLAEAGDEPLLWEAKGAGVQPHAGSVQKAGCGFANSERGGYLIVGADGGKGKPWTLGGVEWRTDEPSTWLLQRMHDLAPAPLCRTHVWPAEDGKSVAIVKVDPVTDTPCVTPDGVVYQRISGATVPVADPYVLSQLFQRGLDARERAHQRATMALEHRFDDLVLYTLGIAPTGMASNPVDQLYRNALSLDLLRPPVEIRPLNTQDGDGEFVDGPHFRLGDVRLSRVVDARAHFLGPSTRDGVSVDSAGTIQVQRCLTRGFGRDEHPEPRGPEPMSVHEDVLPWFGAALDRARVLAVALGAHGDLRVILDVNCAGRHVFWEKHRAEEAKGDFRQSYWCSLEGSPDLDAELSEQVELDIRRFLGAPPPTRPGL